MKKFKKIYIEITNMCNLNCSFCSNDNLKKKEMSLGELEHILNEINDYTDYICLHVKGEPLLHSKFADVLNLCKKHNKKINITTNGTLLKKYKDLLINSNVRQINISLQSLINNDYLDDILESTKEILNYSNIEIVFRFWAIKDNLSSFQKNVIDKIINYFNLNSDIKNEIMANNNIKLSKHLYINKDGMFNWPTLDNCFVSNKGTCYGTRNHVAILVDGTVIPCCLDSKGIINLGNIFDDSFNNIINSERFSNIKTNFQNNKIVEELCTKCDYRKRF